MAEQQQHFARLMHRVVHDPRFTSMTLEQRGAWTTLLVLNDSVWPAHLHRASVVVQALLGADHARLLDELLALGMLDEHGDGEFGVHGLRKYHVRPSETPEAVRDRVARHRQRQREADVTERNDVTDNQPTNVTNQPTRSTRAPAREPSDPTGAREYVDLHREGLPHITSQVQQAGEAATGRAILTGSDKTLTELDRLVEDHGAQAVVAGIAGVPPGGNGKLTWNQLVWGLVKRLEPIPAAPSQADIQAKEHEEAERRRWERSMEANRRRREEMAT